MKETFTSSLVTHIICDEPVHKEDPLLADDCHGKIVNVRKIDCKKGMAKCLKIKI